MFAKTVYYAYLVYALVILAAAGIALINQDVSATLNINRYVLFWGLLLSSAAIVVFAYIWRFVKRDSFYS